MLSQASRMASIVGAIVCAALAIVIVVAWYRHTEHNGLTIRLPIAEELVDGATRRIQANPRDWDAYLARARYNLSCGHYELAEKDLRVVLRAAESQEVRRSANKLLGLGYLEQKRFEDAREAFTAALATGSGGTSEVIATDGELFEHRAAAHFYRGEYERSAEDCELAIAAGNDSRMLRQLKAMNCVKQREWSAALTAIESDPNDVGVLMLRAYALAGLGRLSEAKSARDAARSIDAEKATRWEGFVEVTIPE